MSSSLCVMLLSFSPCPYYTHALTQLNKCLSENQGLWKDRVGILESKMESLSSDKEKEMIELRDQIRDLMFYLETQKKIAKSPEEQRQVRGREIAINYCPACCRGIRRILNAICACACACACACVCAH